MTDSVDVRTPAYCAVCGSRLAPSTDVQGYDPYTGDPVAAAKLHCNNPTVDVYGLFFNKKTSTTYHPSWAQQSDDSWAQYNG